MARKRTATSKTGGQPKKGAKTGDDDPLFVYVRSTDDPKSLDTLPQLPFDEICSYVIADGKYEAIGNLRKVVFFSFSGNLIMFCTETCLRLMSSDHDNHEIGGIICRTENIKYLL